MRRADRVIGLAGLHPTGPRPRRRYAVAGNLISDWSSISGARRLAQVAPVGMRHPPTIFNPVTFRLAKNRPVRNSSGRLPHSRRKQTVLREIICSTIAPPFIEA
jgi:hypothetical protein